MSYMPMPSYGVDCDHCHRRLRDPREDEVVCCCRQDDADRQARMWGWLVERHGPFIEHLCPTCARREHNEGDEQ